jgi:hypothetical protein
MRLSRLLPQTITYWSRGQEDRFGNTAWGAPATRRARWEESQQEVATTSGETFVSKAVLYLDQDVGIGDYVALGDLTAVSDPTLTTDAYEIRAFRTIPDLRNVDKERRAYI